MAAEVLKLEDFLSDAHGLRVLLQEASVLVAEDEVPLWLFESCGQEVLVSEIVEKGVKLGV